MHFDLTQRTVTIEHAGEPDTVLRFLEPLNLGARVSQAKERDDLPVQADPAGEHRVLVALLAINATMFVAELVAGILASSTGLIADSLDMLADAAVYGVSLYAVGRGSRIQAFAARLSGVAQAVLAFALLAEVARRFLQGSEPLSTYMIVVSAIALAANVSCMLLIAKHRHGGVHMKASWIFTTNDVIANLGVIVAAGMVRLTASNAPDLVVASMIALVVLNGAIRILRLKG